jgi:hypothetical protein
MDALDRVGSRLRENPGAGRAGEAHHVDARMAADRGAHARVALNEAEHARRNARIVHDLGKDRGIAGHSSEGLRIIVLPAAIAGATLSAIWLSGQFHG